MSMTKIPVIDGEIEAPDELVSELAKIAHDVLHGITSMDERPIAGYAVDVGGRGVAYGVIRLRRGSEVYRMTRGVIEKFYASLPAEITQGLRKAETPVVPPAPALPHPPPHAAAPSSGPVPQKPAPPTPQEIAVEMLNLMKGEGYLVAPQDLVTFRKWYDEYTKKGPTEAVETVLGDLLQSPSLPPIMRSRIVQYAAHVGTPKLAAAVANSVNDPRLRTFLNDRRVQGLLQKLFEKYRS